MARAALRLTTVQIRGAITVFDCSNEDVIFKSPFLDRTVREGHFSIAMLDALFPLTLIDGPICPEHLTVTISLVIEVVTLVDVAALPIKYTVPVLAILLVLTIILVAGSNIKLFLPLAAPMLETFFELAHVDTSRFPLVLTLALWLTGFVGTCIGVTIRE